MEIKAQSYRDLLIWQKSFELAKEIYRLTNLFPRQEIYGLNMQVRRASVSILSNIAEGFSRKTDKEKAQFMSIAFGSSSEVETQLLLAKDLKFALEDEFKKSEALVNEVRKILNHYILKIRKPVLSH